jgi:hypothetical protein
MEWDKDKILSLVLFFSPHPHPTAHNSKKVVKEFAEFAVRKT